MLNDAARLSIEADSASKLQSLEAKYTEATSTTTTDVDDYVPLWLQRDTRRSYILESNSTTVDNGVCDLFTLYLIRHGEALHNVLEKAARKDALEKCLEEGLSEDDPETKERMESARKAVLNDETLRDAPLTELGREQAKDCRKRLAEMIEDGKLPKPTQCLVSPFTRTLETCDIVFQDLDGIHVREELSERRTGKPPDMRSHASILADRPSFQRFSMTDMLMRSFQNLAEFNTLTPQTFLPEDGICVMQQDLWGQHAEEYDSFVFTEEDRAKLRQRTQKLFALLKQTDEKSIAVVTHKGYLRELERGSFGNPEATEFSNCEIRVYSVKVSNDSCLKEAERVL